MEDEVIEVDRLCRTCMALVELDDNYIFMDKNLCQLLEDIIQIKIYPDDELPHKICNKCLAQLNNLLRFKNQCIGAINKFQNIQLQNTLSENKFVEHSYNLENDAEFLCNLCKAIFQEELELKKHYVYAHKNMYLTNGANTERLVNADKAMFDLINDRRIYGTKKDQIKIKVKDIELMQNRIYPCKVCKIKLTSKYQKAHHICDHFEANELNTFPKACEICDRVFKDNLQFSMHFIKHGLIEQSVDDALALNSCICFTCGQFFELKSAYDAHLLIHTSTNSSKCIECDLAFDSELDLLKHEKDFDHSEYYWDDTLPVFRDYYECPFCGMHFSNKLFLAKHASRYSVFKHVCRICKASFCTDAAFKAHKQTHIEKIHECGKCKDRFDNMVEVRIHQQVMHNVCCMCQVEAVTPEALNDHLSIHIGEELITCSYEFCKQKLSKMRMNEHNKIHLRTNQFECQVCPLTLSERDIQIKHMETHVILNQFICKVCNLNFKYKKNFNKHSLTHTTRKQPEINTKNKFIYRPFKCTLCTSRFKNKHYLERHLLNHTKNDIRRFKCSSCASNFKYKHHLEKHLLIHTRNDVKPFKCTTCTASYTYKHHLDKHLLNHTKNELGRFKCNSCAANFKYKHHLEKHLLIHSRTVMRAFKCMLCTSSFKYKHHLDKHTLINHNLINQQLLNDRPFKCTSCSSSFKSKHHLERHSSIHTRNAHEDQQTFYIRPFKCTFCSTSFRYKYNLNKHLLTHTKAQAVPENVKTDYMLKLGMQNSAEIIDYEPETNKAYNCTSCSDAFKTDKQLLNHMKVHKGGESNSLPYKCKKCNVSFKRKVNFKRHCLLHARQEMSIIQKRKMKVTKQIAIQNALKNDNDLKLDLDDKDISRDLYNCKLCPTVFVPMDKLENHMKRKHSDEFSCNVCAKKFKTKNLLEKHLFTHLGVEVNAEHDYSQIHL